MRFLAKMKETKAENKLDNEKLCMLLHCMNVVSRQNKKNKTEHFI